MKHHSILYTALILVLSCALAAAPAIGEEFTEFEGLIEPYELVNIGTPVEGVVEHVHVQRSALVEKGDPLVQLESSVEIAVVKRSRALADLTGEIQLQEERLAFAQRMYTRVEELFNSEAISAEKNDQAATEVTLAYARLQKANEDKTLARLDLERVQAMLTRRTIKSPLSGIVVERFVSPGEFVYNQPLLKLAQLDPLRVEVVLPTEMFRKIQLGMQATVKPEIQSDETYSATVVIVDRVIDPASGTFGVRLELSNPDYRLPGGLKCTVQFHPDDIGITSPTEGNENTKANKIIKTSKQRQLLTTLDQ